MPEGPDHWHEFWVDDTTPLDYLEKRGFTWPRGIIIQPQIAGFEVDVLDLAAIKYLIAEWDYDYQPMKVQKT